MRTLLKVLLTLFVLLSAVLFVRTLTFAPPNDGEVAPLNAREWDTENLSQGLAGALRFATVSNADPAKVDGEVFAAFRAYLAERFPKSFSEIPHELVNDGALLFRWEGADPSLQPILLLAHQDVVPVIPGTEDEWTHPPFAGAIADGYIWGRGAFDDKASVLGILEAVERLLGEGFEPPRTIYLAFGHDEEVGGQRGAVAIAKRIEQRGERLAFVLDEGSAIVAGLIPGVEQRVALIGPAEKGYVSLELSARGEGGHSSMPPRQTAAGIIGAAVSRLEAHPFPANLEYTVELMRHLGDAQPFMQRLLFANSWLFSSVLETVLGQNPTTNAGMRTTTAVTMLSGSVQDNVLPIKASAVVNFRILPGDTVESVRAYVEEVIDDPRIKISYYDDFGSEPSPVTPTDSAGFRVLSEIIRQVSPGTLVAPRMVVAATDARHFVDVADSSYRFLGLELGPEELKGIHGTDERVSVESYVEAVRIYYHLLHRAAEL